MFSFVHAADLHLDSPMRGVPAEGPFRRATFVAFERLIGLCLRERPAFLVLAGDLFDQKDRSVRARLALREGLVRLHAAGVRTFIVHGNHDPLSADPGGLGLPDSVKVFGPEWEEVLLPGVCRVQGVSYPHERVTENLSARFSRRGPEPTVAVLHANVGANAAHAAYAPCTVGDLDAVGLDYWALGHVHTRAEHLLSRGGVAVYPGNLQGRHVNEEGPRGCVVVQIDGERCSRRFVSLEAVRWHRVELSIEGVSTVDGLAEAAFDRVVEMCGDDPAHLGHAVRLVLNGRGELHPQLHRSGAWSELEEVLRERMARRAVPIHLESLGDGTRSELDLEKIRAAGGLAATVLSASRELDLEELYRDEALVRLEAALQKHGLNGTRGEAPALLEAASRRVVDLLMGEEVSA
jgi:exonuclease SbcD